MKRTLKQKCVQGYKLKKKSIYIYILWEEKDK